MPITSNCDPPEGPFTVGSKVRLSASFTDLTEDPPEPADPSSVICRVKKPDDTIDEPAVVREELGEYYSDIVLDLPGQWFFSFEGTGDLVVKEGETFFAEALEAGL
jgi:hypothetical protein